MRKVLVVIGLVGVLVVAGMVMAFSGWADWLLGSTAGGKWGRFSGEPKATWLANGRDMRLDDDFSHTDPQRRVWPPRRGRWSMGPRFPERYGPSRVDRMKASIATLRSFTM